MGTPATPRTATAAILAVAAYRGYVEAVPGTTAPLVRGSFGLGESELASVMGLVAVSSVASIGIGRLFDRHGRRPVLLACVLAIPLFSLASAVATSLSVYVAAQIALFALASAMLAGASVTIAESMPDSMRAAALARVGILDAIGGGAAIVLLPLVIDLPGSWRWLWFAAVLPVLGFGVLRRSLPESDRWREARSHEPREGRGLRVIASPAHRSRAVHVTGSFLCLQVSNGALLFWPYYHALEGVGLSPAVASSMVVGGGLVGLLGFTLGGRLAEAFGRRATTLAGTLAAVAAGIWFYTTAGGTSALVSLVPAYVLLLASTAVAAVASQTATLELFPTGVRATAAAWLGVLTALGAVLAHFIVASLAARVGGLPAAVAIVGCVGIPGAFWFALRIPETRGRSLEDSSGPRDLTRAQTPPAESPAAPTTPGTTPPGVTR